MAGKIALEEHFVLAENIAFLVLAALYSHSSSAGVCTEEQLVDALTGRAQPLHREMLVLQLERLQLIDTQIVKLNGMIAQAIKPHQEAVMRLAEVPGLGVGFGAADHRGSEPAGQHVPIGGGVDLLGGNLSRERRRCRTEPQQSLRQRQ